MIIIGIILVIVFLPELLSFLLGAGSLIGAAVTGIFVGLGKLLEAIFSIFE